MRPIFRGLLTVVVIVGYAINPSASHAQSEFKDGEGKVSDLTIAQRGGKPWMVWVAAQNYRPRYLPTTKDADIVPGVTFKFMQPCFVAQTWQGNNQTFHLVGKQDPNDETKIVPYGWVHSKLIVENPFAQRIDGTGTGNYASGLSQKAMIINTVESIRRAREFFTLPLTIQNDLENPTVSEAIITLFGKNQLLIAKSTRITKVPRSSMNPMGPTWILIDDSNDGLQRYELTKADDGFHVVDSLAQAAVYDSPALADLTPNRQTTFRLYNIFFVYREFTFDPNDDKATWVLVGNKSDFGSASTQEEVSKIVRGWIRRDRLSYWNTRECLAWEMDSIQPYAKPRPRDLGMIWNFPDDADSWLEGKATDNEPFFLETLAVDPIDKQKKPVPFGANDPRFAVLTDSKGSDMANNRRLKVGVVGALSGGDSADLEAKRKRILEQLAEAQDALKTIELIFVIDDSESMRHAFKPVGDVVSETLLRLLSVRRNHDLTLKVGFTFYSDKPAEPPILAGELQLVFDPTMSEADAKANIAQLVDGAEVRKNGMLVRPEGIRRHRFRAGGLLPEMVFDGIHEGMDKFTNSSSRKILIHVGDHCDNLGGDRPLGNPLLDEELEGINLISKRIFPTGRSPIEFYSIQVAEAERKNPHDVAVRLKQQMQKMCEITNQKARTLPGNNNYEIAKFVENADVEALQSAIKLRLEQLLKDTLDWQNQLTLLRQGEWNTQVAPGLIAQLKEKGIPFDQLKQFDGAQLYSEGWVWVKARGMDDVPQVRVQYLLNAGELFRIVEMLKTLVGDETQRSDDPETVRMLIKAVLKSETGEDKEALSIDEVFKQKHGIRFVSGILKKTPDEIKEGFTPQEVRDLKLKLVLLQELISVREVQKDWMWFEEKDPDSGARTFKLRQKTPDDPTKPDRDRVKRFFKQPGSEIRWIYLDAKELP